MRVLPAPASCKCFWRRLLRGDAAKLTLPSLHFHLPPLSSDKGRAIGKVVPSGLALAPDEECTLRPAHEAVQSYFSCRSAGVQCREGGWGGLRPDTKIFRIVTAYGAFLLMLICQRSSVTHPSPSNRITASWQIYTMSSPRVESLPGTIIKEKYKKRQQHSPGGIIWASEVLSVLVHQ